MDLALNGKAAFVGGGSKGIGRAIAMALAAEGCNVAIAARRESILEKAASDIEKVTGSSVMPISCDLADYNQVEDSINKTAGHFNRLDILINNAGGPSMGTLEDLSEDKWSHALDQNFLSMIRACRVALPYLRQSGSGRIINITSVSVKQPIERLILSNSVRMGVVGAAKTLSREVGVDGITVNNICPGNIATDRLISLLEERAKIEGSDFQSVIEAEERRVPMRFLGEPDDVASLVVFLASPQARYISGATIQVDGGSTLATF